MRLHERWEKGWLKNKPFVYNPKHPFYNPLVDRILKHMKKGQNAIILVVGTPRSGNLLKTT
jgi:hypothetical protein